MVADEHRRQQSSNGARPSRGKRPARANRRCGMRSVQRGQTVAREFRDFVLRGNMVELAVAFVMGAAFTNVVSAFTNGVLLPLIAAAGGKSNLGALTWKLREDNVIAYGQVLSAVIALILAAAVLFL